VPEYYRAFVRQADDVADELGAVGEPEILKVATASDGAVQRAEAVTAAFAEAAHRHRHTDEAVDVQT
jgi:hypothetical protein